MGYSMPKGNYRSVSVREELVDHVETLIRRVGIYHSVAEFFSEATRLRIEAIEKHERARGVKPWKLKSWLYRKTASVR